MRSHVSFLHSACISSFMALIHRGSLATSDSVSSSRTINGVRDEFLDAELFKVTAEAMVDETVAGEDKCLTDMHRFLSTRLPPEVVSRDEHKHRAIQSQHFFLVQVTLYHKGKPAETMDNPEDKRLIDITYFLSTRLPPKGMQRDEKKRLAFKSRNFYLIKDILYHKGADGIWRRCVQSDEKSAILREAHCREAMDTM